MESLDYKFASFHSQNGWISNNNAKFKSTSSESINTFWISPVLTQIEGEDLIVYTLKQ